MGFPSGGVVSGLARRPQPRRAAMPPTLSGIGNPFAVFQMLRGFRVGFWNVL